MIEIFLGKIVTCNLFLNCIDKLLTSHISGTEEGGLADTLVFDGHHCRLGSGVAVHSARGSRASGKGRHAQWHHPATGKRRARAVSFIMAIEAGIASYCN